MAKTVDESKSVEGAVSIDQALEETKFGRLNYCLIIISGLIMINVVLECLGISFVLPVINCDMNLSYQEKGILGGVGFVGIITSSHLWGFLADTTGRKNVIKLTLVASYMVTVVSSLAPNFLVLACLRYVNGFLISGGSATIYAYLGEFHCNKLRNRAIMSAAFISALAAIFHPVVAWAVINQASAFYIPVVGIVYAPWRLYILCIGLLGIICGVWFFFLPESPKYLLSAGMEKEAIAVLRHMYSINTGNSPDQYRVTSLKPDFEDEQKFRIKNTDKGCAIVTVARSMWNQTVPLFMREHCRKTILACVIQFWIFFTAHGLYVWFPLILNKVMQFTSTSSERLDICEIIHIMDMANSINSTAGVENQCTEFLELSTYQHTISLEFIYVGLFLGVGYITGKFGRIPTLFIILVVCGVCGILCVVVTIPLVAIYCLVVLLVCGLATTVLNVITVDMFPTHLRAMAVCISLMMGRIGSVAGTNLIGGLLENHCKTAFFTANIALILSGLLGFLLPTGTNEKNKPKPRSEA